jgi:hypothetical protein
LPSLNKTANIDVYSISLNASKLRIPVSTPKLLALEVAALT